MTVTRSQLGALAGGLLLLVACGHACAFVDAPDPALSELLTTLRAPTSTADERVKNATKLLATDSLEARTAVRALLETAPTPQTAPTLVALLKAIAAKPVAPAALVIPLAKILDHRDEFSPLAAAALGSVRAPEAARALLDCGKAVTTPTLLRGACFEALTRLSGRGDLGSDPAAWAAWLDPVEFLPEARWRGVLTEGLAARLDEIAALNLAATNRLIEARRRELLDAPAGARSGLLAALMNDDLPALRMFGVEAVKRELANARVLDANVVEAAVEMLADPLPAFRVSGAELLAALAPPQAAEVIGAALSRENDPAAADALLAAAARWPSPGHTAPVMRWIQTPPSPARGAVEAAAALVRAGLLQDAGARMAVVARLRLAEPADLSPGGVWLLTHAGDENDYAKVAAWIESDSPAMRRAAAEAIADRPGGVERILKAAQKDGQLAMIAARGVEQIGATSALLVELAGLPWVTSEARGAGLATATASLAPPALLAVAKGLSDPAGREAMLARLVNLAVVSPEAGPGADAALVQGLVALARCRLEVGQPGGALLALDALDPLVRPADRTEADALRTTALIWLNRVEDAVRLGAAAGAWLDGLERCVTLPHARAVRKEIESRFGGRLSPEDETRLKDLAAKVASALQEP